LKVRSEPAIFLQEAMTIFAANFIRWAAVWIKQRAKPDKDQLQIEKMGIKRQVQVLAHTSAKVIQNSGDMLLRFSPASCLAGKSPQFRALDKPVRLNYFFATFYVSRNDCTTVTLTHKEDIENSL
jgi:hypothetical protein